MKKTKWFGISKKIWGAMHAHVLRDLLTEQFRAYNANWKKPDAALRSQWSATPKWELNQAQKRCVLLMVLHMMERAVRFSNREIEVLVDLVRAHIIVEEKRVDFTTNAVKKQAWENITAEFWRRTASNRTEYQLLKKWKNLKHAARKYEAAINNKEQCVPGRGPPPRSPIFEEVLELLRQEQEAFRNNKADVGNMCLTAPIKVEEESHSDIDPVISHVCSDGSSNWEQEEDISSPQDDDIREAPLFHRVEMPSQEIDLVEESGHFMTVSGGSYTDNNSRKNSEVVDCIEDSSDDVISVVSVGSVPAVMENTLVTGKVQQSEIQQQCNFSTVADSSKLAQLMLDKELAIKSAQLALLEKENKIKDLDIKIRQEQLADMMIRRRQEEELHEMRKKRMLHGIIGECVKKRKV